MNGHELVKLTATPKYLSELAVGYLYCSGIIDCIDRVESLDVDETRGKVYVATSDYRILNDWSGDCSGITCSCDVAPVDPNDLLRLMNEFEKSCHLFHETGGSHGAAISDAGNYVAS